MYRKSVRITCKVDNVSADADIEGEMQTINQIFPLPLKESDKTRVNFEFLNGICVLFLSINAEMQCPRVDKLPFMQVNSLILSSFSSFVMLYGILNFSEPAKSTILNFKNKNYHLIFFEITVELSL